MMKRLLVSGIVAMFLLCPAIALAQSSYTSLFIYGWSKDSQYWAFVEEGDYSGGAMVGKTAKIYVINAAKNDFHKTWKKEVSEKTGVQDEDKIESGIRAFQRDVRRKLKARGIEKTMGREVYKKRTAQWTESDTKLRQFGSKRVSFTSGGISYEIKLSDEVFPNKDNPWATKSKFSIAMRRKGGPRKVLQADKKPWRNFIEYRIVYVSVSPCGTHAAVLVEAIQNAFENAKISHYKAVCGKLP